eukprot:1160123-Pelagomonas_calceolata.AAC.6
MGAVQFPQKHSGLWNSCFWPVRGDSRPTLESTSGSLEHENNLRFPRSSHAQVYTRAFLPVQRRAVLPTLA